MTDVWSGVFPAAVTHFRDDQSLNLPATLKHLDAMVAAGVHGLIVLGTVGENCSLEYAEKVDVLKAAVCQVRGRVPVLTGVAECSTALACRFAADAKKAEEEKRTAEAKAARQKKLAEAKAAADAKKAEEAKRTAEAKAAREKKQAEAEELNLVNSRNALQDQLTGLANRRSFFLSLERLLQQNPNEPPVIGIIDLDGFKPVNDVFGHSAGDLVLKETARRFAALAGSEAVVSRLGEPATMRVGLVCNAVGLLLLAPPEGGWWLLVPALALLVAGQGVLAPTLSSAVAARAPDRARGESLGIQQAAGGLARVTGPALAGLLFERIGPAAPYYVGAGLERQSVINCDGIHTLTKASLTAYAGTVEEDTMDQVCSAIGYALGC